MGLTGFNRARRQVAEKLGASFDEVPYEQAAEMIKESPNDYTDGTDAEGAEGQKVLSHDEGGTGTEAQALHAKKSGRDERFSVLTELPWTELKTLLEQYGLSTNKPKGQSWEDYAIPLILKAEGYE